MNVRIFDFLKGDCEISGKGDVDCVRVALDDATPEAVISVTELVKILRFKKRQEEKTHDHQPTLKARDAS